MSESPSDPFAFEPVPSASNRHDGCTPERQRSLAVWAPEIRWPGRKKRHLLDILNFLNLFALGVARILHAAVASGNNLPFRTRIVAARGART